MASISAGIADDLRKQIRNGILSPGSTLPLLTELVERYGVSRQTVRSALQELRSEGLITSRGGSSSYTVRQREPRRMIERPRQIERDSIGYFTDRIAQHWRFVEGGRTRVLFQSVTDDDVAIALGVRLGSEALTRIRSIGSTTQPELRQHVVTWIHPLVSTALPVLAETEVGMGGYLDAVERWHGTPLTFDEVVTAHTASPEERQALLLPNGVPVLRILRIVMLGRQ